MIKRYTYILLGAALLAGCTPEDEKLLDYCHGIADASDSIVRLRDQGIEKDAVLSLITRSEVGEDPVLLSHVTRNINFAYQYRKMPLEIYHREVLNHCLASGH